MANYPLVPEEEPPQDCTFDFPGLWWFEHLQTPFFFFFFFILLLRFCCHILIDPIWWHQELFDIDQQKCFALQIKPERLQEIRDLTKQLTFANNWHFLLGKFCELGVSCEVRNGWSSSIAPTHNMQTCALVFSGCETYNLKQHPNQGNVPMFQHWSHILWAWKLVEKASSGDT